MAAKCEHVFERNSWWRGEGVETYGHIRCPWCGDLIDARELCKCALCGVSACAVCVILGTPDEDTDPDIIIARIK